MNKLRNLNKGFSLVEIAVILVVIGVLFIAASSIIQGRSSAIEISRTENRLKQANDILLGTLKYTGFVPYIKPPDLGLLEPVPDKFRYLERNFEKLVVMPDGYGNPFKYVHGRGSNDFYLRTPHFPGGDSSTNLCRFSWSNLSLQFPDKRIDNVIYLLFSTGKDGRAQITTNGNYDGRYEGAYVANIPLNDPDFDDKYMYATFEEVRSIQQCPMTEVDHGLQILTKTLAMKKEGSSLEDTNPATGTTITRNILFSNSLSARWCVEVITDAGIDPNIAKKQIEVFRLTDAESYIKTDEVIPIRDNGGCENEADFTGVVDKNNSSHLQVVLNRNQAGLKKGEYRYMVHVLDNVWGTKRRDKQIIKIRVPKDP